MMRRCLMWGIMAGFILGIVAGPVLAQQKHVRTPHVAGQFYPANAEALRTQIAEYLNNAPKIELPGHLHALIAPHAGYIYSAPIAAYAYKQLEHSFKRVFIFASNHSRQANFEGLSIPDYTHYATPLGEVPVSSLTQVFRQQARISFVPEAHTTHIVEVHLPFLQTVLEDFEIIPVITGRLTPEDIVAFGELFSQYADERTLFLVSTDLSHYHPYQEAVLLDRSCTYALEALDADGVINSELCGQNAALILLEIAKKYGWQGKTLEYRNSGDTAGDKNRVVGYSAIAYYTPDEAGKPLPETHSSELSGEEQQRLLDLARDTLERYVREHAVFEPDIKTFSAYRNLIKPRGTFVTLKKFGQLRGCIGDLIGRQPLVLGVRDNTINAASRDPRFTPVTEKELPDITLSISVLDVPKLLKVETPEDYLTTLTHQDGVILIHGSHRSTYLPQVWEQLPDPVEFLSRLCRKGGSHAECWKDPETQIYTYRAQEFGAK